MKRQNATKVQKPLARVNRVEAQAGGSLSVRHPLLALQRSMGNQAVQRLINSPYIQARLQPSKAGDYHDAPISQPGFAVAYGGSPYLHGQADATFDRGKKTIANVKIAKSSGCDCVGNQPCMNATGTLLVTYKATVKITMPPMPNGLTKCEQGRVAAFFKNVLGPHEQEHKRRYETYNGTTRHSIEGRGCGQAEARNELDSEAQRIHDDEAPERERAAKDYSGLLDPFFEMADFDGCK